MDTLMHVFVQTYVFISPGQKSSSGIVGLYDLCMSLEELHRIFQNGRPIFCIFPPAMNEGSGFSTL